MQASAIESRRQSRHNKQSLIAVGVLLLSLAALQSPLWRFEASRPVFVRSGGAVLIASEKPIARITLDGGPEASAEVVGEHEVLIRGRQLGEAELRIITNDGRASDYRVVVQAGPVRPGWGLLSRL